jgi:integrase/recombinase XerD
MNNGTNENKTISGLEPETKETRTLIDNIKDLVMKAHVTPTTLRYIFKQVRNETQLIVPKHSESLPGYFTPADAWHLIETARAISDTHSLLVQILIETGLRISELHDLDLRDIDMSDNKLYVRAGKGGKDRYVPIGSNIAEKIFLYCKPRTAGYIFVKSNQTPLSVRRLQQMVNEVSLKAGFGTAHPHKLRHTFACILINKGIPLEDIQLYMGHSSKITTEIYAKLTLTPEQKQKYLQLFP